MNTDKLAPALAKIEQQLPILESAAHSTQSEWLANPTEKNRANKADAARALADALADADTLRDAIAADEAEQAALAHAREIAAAQAAHDEAQQAFADAVGEAHRAMQEAAVLVAKACGPMRFAESWAKFCAAASTPSIEGYGLHSDASAARKQLEKLGVPGFNHSVFSEDAAERVLRSIIAKGGQP